MVTTAELSENSHPGFEGIRAAFCRAEMEANSNLAIGIEPCLRRNGTRSRCSGKERDAESGLDYFGARYFSGAQGRWTTPDIPFADQRVEDPQSWNLYNYVRNNPLTFIDPAGRSTHTGSVGNVVAVYDDDDLGVYEHDNLVTTSGPTMQRPVQFSTKCAEGARILFGSSFDSDVQRLGQQAAGMVLMDVASQSGNGGYFDIKTNSSIAPFGRNTGRLLNGKYATARSAGNFLAGYNAAVGTFMGVHISFETDMKLAGALRTGNWRNGMRSGF